MEVLGYSFGNVAGTAGTFSQVLSWGLLILAVGGLLYLLYYLFTFKNTIVIREVINGRKIIHTKKWKIQKDKNNNLWLITPFKKLKKQIPPTESIDLTTKAKKWVEAWRGDDSETFIWCKDDFQYEDFKKTNYQEFQPLMTAERELLVNEIAKSNAYNKRSTMDVILQLAPYMFLIILIAVISFTIGDVTTALTDFNSQMTEPLAKVSTAFERASENLGGIQNPDVIPVAEVPN